MEQTNNDTTQLPALRSRRRRVLRILALFVSLAILFMIAVYSYAYTTSPASIRQPAFQHYHFRMQILVNGKAVNFADKAFQEGYSKDNCNVDLTTHPIHFHDGKDQMAHIHWDHMTGGLVLKYYGWNYVGGQASTLGYRFDTLPRVMKVPIHGKSLPEVPKDSTFYVYTGDKDHHTARSWNDFLQKDLEDLFGQKSNLGEQSSLLDKLFPRAYAHGSEPHSLGGSEDEKLRSINNLLGNVVIFVQKERPSEAQVMERFANLLPLERSTCGG